MENKVNLIEDKIHNFSKSKVKFEIKLITGINDFNIDFNLPLNDDENYLLIRYWAQFER